MNLAATHHQIARRNYSDVVKECAALHRQLVQRDHVLWLILHRVGRQAITAADLATIPRGAEVVCRDDLAGGAIFEAVDADAIIGAANEFARNDTELQGGQVVSHRTHNPEIVGSNPTPATNEPEIEILKGTET